MEQEHNQASKTEVQSTKLNKLPVVNNSSAEAAAEFGTAGNANANTSSLLNQSGTNKANQATSESE